MTMICRLLVSPGMVLRYSFVEKINDMKTAQFTIILLAVLSHFSNAQTADKASQKFNKQFVNQPKSNRMETQSMAVVKEFLNAVQTGNNEKLAAILHPDIQWVQPGDSRVSGIKKSGGEVFQMVGTMFAASANTLTLTEIKSVTAHGNSVACLIHWKAAQPTGKTLDVDNIDVYTVEDGKIVEAKIYSSDLSQEDDFWGK